MQDGDATKATDPAAPAVGSKRKADPAEDARAAAGDLAKKHRAAAEALFAGACTKATDAEDTRESFHLACRFFDEAGAGYLEDKDLEDIIHTVHPLTSRRWVRTLVESVCRRGRLRYADLPNMHVAYHPPPPPPLGLEATAAAGAGGGGTVVAEGVTVDVCALRAAAMEMSEKLQEKSGACAHAQVRLRCVATLCPGLCAGLSWSVRRALVCGCAWSALCPVGTGLMWPSRGGRGSMWHPPRMT